MIWFLTTQRKIRSACLQNSIISHQREFSGKKNIDYNITEKRQIITSQGKKIDYNNVTEKKQRLQHRRKKKLQHQNSQNNIEGNRDAGHSYS